MFFGTNKENTLDALKKHRMMQKLNEKQVREIRQRCKNGEYRKDICKDYGVTAACVGHIAIGKTWKHVS